VFLFVPAYSVIAWLLTHSTTTGTRRTGFVSAPRLCNAVVLEGLQGMGPSYGFWGQSGRGVRDAL